MRRRNTVALCLMAGLALALAGCQNPAAPPRAGVRLRPVPPPEGAGDAPMFQVRVVRLQHRLRPDAPMEDLWRLLGTTSVPYEKQSLWEANDLRLGEGARMAADRMNELAAETPDRTTQANTLVVRENLDFAISLGGDRDALELLWTDAAGRLEGRRFDRAVAQFRLVCRTDPKDPQAVCIALVPEVLYGPTEMRRVRTEGATVQRMARASMVLGDLAAEVRLGPGRLLVLGSRRTSDLSVGGGLFYERRGPDVWVQTIVLAAERLLPGRVPEGEIPFLAPAKSPAPAKAPTKPEPAPKPGPPTPTRAPAKAGG